MKIKKARLTKIVLIIMIVSLTLLLNARQVNAANNIFTDLTNTINSNTSSNNTTENTTTNNSTNTTILTTNNTSVANNTSLPKTGLEENSSIMLLLTISVISAVYAYKKVQDYKNID